MYKLRSQRAEQRLMYFWESQIEASTEKAICICILNTHLTFWHQRHLCRRVPNQIDQPPVFSCWVASEDWMIEARENRQEEPYDEIDTWTGTVAEAADKFGIQLGGNA